MRVLRFHDRNFSKAISAFHRTAAPSPDVQKTVAEIIAQVRERGDRALIELTEKFGGPQLRAGDLRVVRQEFAEPLDAGIKRAVSAAHANVRDFAKLSLRKSWQAMNRQGVEVGERFDPFDRVGIYIPAGTAPLVSTAIMTVTLAAVAGVPEIVVTTPAAKSGKIHPALLFALQLAGATEVYKVGGAQAIAALAFGTATIAPVCKIFGPGNAYVVEAKRQVFGTVAIDLLPGPSEILIIADKSGNAAWIAADLLAQAEHGHGSLAVFISDSEALVEKVKHEIEQQRKLLQRSEHLAEALAENCVLVLVRRLEDAVEIANDFAPEHLTLIARNEKKLAAQIRTAGAIFLGPISPVVGGDFVAGPSHELPTGGAGKSFSGLTVDQFQRRTSIVRFDKESLQKSLPIIEAFSRVEGLDAHGRSASIRFQT
ncbi:MAG: histidinol dehydrogenase [Verrucomicrobiota bacterium]|nr:histidinol dehydrogenase [Verrucomicrobiota bacterium]